MVYNKYVYPYFLKLKYPFTLRLVYNMISLRKQSQTKQTKYCLKTILLLLIMTRCFFATIQTKFMVLMVLISKWKRLKL